MDIKTKIKRLRGLKGWTQGQMAEHFGVTADTIHNWERRGIKPKKYTMNYIDALYKQELRELIRREVGIT